MKFLRTNTATRITVGPFLDKTDGITPEVALTVTSEKLTFVVDTGGVPTLVLDVAPTASGGANDMVHITGDDAGFYDLELAAADVNYLGRARLSINDVATHCPVFHEFMILPAVVYDALVLGTDTLTVDVTQWTGTNVATPTVAGVPVVDLGIIRRGTAGAAGAQTLTLAAETAPTVDFFRGSFVRIISATAGAGQMRGVTASTSANPPVLTLDYPWVDTPTGTIVYEVIQGTPVPALTDTQNCNVVQVSGDSTAADNLESMLDGTGGVTLTATLSDLTTTVTDSIPADGTRPSIKQALYMLTQFMTERSVTSTTVTVNKVDGTTALFTLTLNDATTPTAITRAT